MKSFAKKIIIVTLQELKKEFSYSLMARKPHKIVFDHLPKCGGSSLGKFLESNFPRRRTFTIDGLNPKVSVEEFQKFSASKRYKFDLVKGHLGDQLFDYVHPESFKITVLREPVDRIVSHYYYAKRTQTHYLYPKIHDSAMSLEDYVTSGMSEELRNWYTTHFTGLSVEEAEKDPDRSIDNAFKVLQERYDIIGFLDNFTSFFSTLQKVAGLRHGCQNERENVTQGRIAANDIPRSTIRKIEQINRLDIELFKRIKTEVG